MGYSELTSDALSLDSVMAQVRSPRNGGYVTFSGDVRNHDAGEPVAAIEYQAYDALARRELARIVADAEQQWPEATCAVAHRVGLLRVGESSVVIAVGAPHRAEAFEACRWIIDALKVSVPIWKREEYADGLDAAAGGDGRAGGEAVWIEGERQVPAATRSEA